MFTITKEFRFEASHQLKGLPANHQCSRLHGHSYRVEVVLRSPLLDKHGFVFDYNDLYFFQKYLDRHVEHRHLNEQFDFQPSAENLARHFFNWILSYFATKQLNSEILYAVRVKETAKTVAEYCPALSQASS